MRQCPTLSGDQRPLIMHSIENCLCVQRQREFYHKCHRCEYRGKSADYVVPGTNGQVPIVAELVIEAAVDAPAPVATQSG